MSADTAQIIIDKPATEVFTFLSDPYNLDLWSFGTWQIEVDATGLVKGNALHTGQINYVRIQAHADQQLIDFWLGSSTDAMLPRIFARVIPGNSFAATAESSMLLLVALRTSEMTEQRWQSLKSAHAVEVGLIKSLVETGYDHRRA